MLKQGRPIRPISVYEILVTVFLLLQQSPLPIALPDLPSFDVFIVQEGCSCDLARGWLSREGNIYSFLQQFPPVHDSIPAEIIIVFVLRDMLVLFWWFLFDVVLCV